MKIISWNVNGLKSIIEKGFLEEIIAQNPDILCLQEVKSTEIPEIENYISYNYPASELVNLYGTAIYTKVEPLSARKGFGDKEFDAEGRVIRMEFENFYLYNVYCPSGASSPERLDRKFRFYDEFTEYVYKSNKPSIICGDFNRISAEIDAKNPKNIKGKSGFLPEEQEWFKEILAKYVDAFRKFHKDGDNFTWWSNRKGAREANKGYRFDYFLVSNTFENTLADSYILKDQMGSDHAPIVLDLNSCPVCGTVNNNDNEFCYQCGIKMIETEEEEEAREEKLEIPKDKIIRGLGDVNMKFNSELILQRNTQNNLDLFNLEFVATEFQYNDLRFDTLAFDEETNSFVIIEYKNKLDFEVLNQGETYYNLLLDNKQVYIDKYNEVFKTEFKEEDFDFDKTKVLIIGPKFNKKQLASAKSPHYPFEIWKVKVNEKFCISYENVITNEIKYLQVTKDDLELTEEELLQDRSDEVIELYEGITNGVINKFPDAIKRILIDAFAYYLNDKLICKFVFLSKFLKVYFYTNEINDIKGKMEDITGKGIEGNTYYRFKLTSKEDIDYFIEMFKQLYD